MSEITKIDLPRNQGTLTVKTYQQATETRGIDITVIELTFDDGHGDRRQYVELSADGRPDRLRASRFQVVLDNHDTDNFEPRPEPAPPSEADMAAFNDVYNRLFPEKAAGEVAE